MKRKIKCWMICSYFFVLAVFILIYLAIQHETEKQIRELYLDRQKTAMNQTMMTVDEQVEAITKMCLGIVQEPYVQYFPFVGKKLDKYDQENVTKLLKNIRSHYTNDPFVEDFYLFYENSERIAHANGFYSEENFYQMEWHYEDVHIQQQARELLRQSGNFFLPSAWMSNGTKKTENITFFYQIGNHVQNQPGKSAKLVVLLKKVWLDEMIIPVSKDGKTSIRESFGGKELYCFNSEGFPKDFLGERGTENVESMVLEENSQRYLLTRLDSQKTGWIYESILPYEIITSQMKEAVKPMSVGLFLYLLIGIPACILMAVWNYMPIRQLTTHMEEKYKELERKYDSTLQEFDSASRKLKKNRERIQEGIWLQLIDGYWKDEQEIEERLQSLGIVFPHPKFCLAIIQVENFLMEKEVLDAKEKALQLFILKNVAQEFLETVGLVIPVPASSRQLFLVMNLSDAGYIGEKISPEFTQLLQQMKTYFQKELKISLSIGVGSLCSEVRHLHLSFRRAERALEYGFILGKSSLLIYDQTVLEEKGRFVFHGNMEKLLFGAMAKKDAAFCISLLDELYADAVEQKISVEEGKYLHMVLADTAMKVIEKANVRADKEEACQDMVTGILSSKTLPEAFPVMKELLILLCEEKQGNERERKLEKQVMEEIQKHYSDPAFSLPLCAEHFGVSPEHLSRTIKSLTGRKFVDIVNSLRLEQAKWYLLETDKKMEEIAELSGYGTVKSFFRSFKQAEGMPPGMWRKERRTFN